MPEYTELHAASGWHELRATDDDWRQADPALLKTLFVHVALIRVFEEYVLDLARKGLVHGPAHSSIGQEGGAAGAVLALRPADTINGSHRGHHQFLSKALGYLAPDGVDPEETLRPDLKAMLRRTLAEICGLAEGYCRGRGGSMHLRWREAGAMGTNAIVGGAVPQAAGFAWASRQAGDDAVSVTFLGDGAVNIGAALETFNLAAAWRLPVCFFIENNQYAVATTVEEATGESRLSARGPGFGIRSWRVDGMDPLAVHLAMVQAVEHMRAGHGPTLIEADVYRYFHQNGPFPGSAFGYRTKDEEAEWKARDPLDAMIRRLAERELLTEAGCEKFLGQAKDALKEIGAALLEPLPGGKRGEQRIRPALWPDPEFVDVGIRSDLKEFEGARVVDDEAFDGEVVQRRFMEVIPEVMHRRMLTDDRIVVLGEDVHKLGGGTNGATKGLAAAFPGRVLGTPICENAFAGLAGGIAVDNRFRPVVELMYADFVWVAADQVFNQIGKVRHMFGGDIEVPLVLRTKIAMGAGYGSQHSMDPAGIFATAVGWRIVAPSTPFDYVGLMNSALTCDDPVLVIEHVDLYKAVGPGPADDLDYCLPVGRASVKRPGTDLTVLTYSAMTNVVLEAAGQLDGIDVEVVDLRWLDRASLDWDTIDESVRKTNNVVIVEQGAAGTSYGAWLADEIQRRLFDWLDQPVQRVHGGEAAPSISKVLEQAAIARAPDVVETLTKIAQ
ncbi:MFS transporter [Prauserella sp. PE36]|uniref:alpha-ketoacid dehydrogenase subunit alpha/beta n=1 Tax=Prauserella sp. PE36 TaxID=1504709 RepID=UPI000DE4C0D9|nr:alpha-ketoacid dehydrogenase subunit alpha/beta [Prauserella sp. PE36]RBM22954.1 MFS transporter [Prauserella sp. PE36]